MHIEIIKSKKYTVLVKLVIIILLIPRTIEAKAMSQNSETIKYRYIFECVDTSGTEINLYRNISDKLNKHEPGISTLDLSCTKKSFLELITRYLNDLKELDTIYEKYLIVSLHGEGTSKIAPTSSLDKYSNLMKEIAGDYYQALNLNNDEYLWDYEIMNFYKDYPNINFVWIITSCNSSGIPFTFIPVDTTLYNKKEVYENWAKLGSNLFPYSDNFKKISNRVFPLLKIDDSMDFHKLSNNNISDIQPSPESLRVTTIKSVFYADIKELKNKSLANIFLLASASDNSPSKGENLLQSLAEYKDKFKPNTELNDYDLFVGATKIQIINNFYLFNIYDTKNILILINKMLNN